MPNEENESETTEQSLIDGLKEAKDDAAQKAAAEFVDEYIANSKDDILDDETVAGLMADTNTGAWDVDDYTVTDVSIDEEAGTILVSLTFSASGEVDSERPFSGDTISGTAQATIDADGTVKYEVERADTEDVSDPEED